MRPWIAVSLALALALFLSATPSGALAMPGSPGLAEGPGFAPLPPTDQAFPLPTTKFDRSIAWEWTGGPEGAAIFCLVATPAGTMLAGTENEGLWRSVDGGASWEQTDNGLTWPCCNFTIQSLATGRGVVYAGTWGGGVYRSDDDGERDWAAMCDGLTDLNMRCLVSGCGTLWLGLESGGVRRWNETNAEWDSSGLDGPAVFSICDAGGTMLAGSWGALYASNDTGSTWVNEIDGLKEFLAVYALAAGDEHLFAGLAGGGVWRAPRATVGAPSAEDGTPATSAQVFRAAPNPFVRDSRVAFDIGRAKKIRLDVYDAAGRRVRSLVDGKLAPGFHEMTWDGANDEGAPAAAGVYFIRLVEDGEASTIKTVRLR